MKLRKVLFTLATLALGALPAATSLAQDSAQGVIIITGTSASISGTTLTIEGASTVLPLIYSDEEGQENTYYPTADFKTDWGFAYLIANDPASLPQPANESLTPEQAQTSGTLTATEVVGDEAIDFEQSLILTNPNYDETTGSLSFDVEVGDLVASVAKAKAPASYSQFVLYVDLTPEFLQGLSVGAQYAEDQGRASGAKRCRPRRVKC